MDTNRRILLFTGGNLGDWALSEIKPDDVLVGIDRGALFLTRHQRKLDFALGDFDSVTLEELQEIKDNCPRLDSCDPVLKDLTDTEMGFVWAMEQQPREVVLLGALGSRFDHTLANVHLLRTGMLHGVPCRIIDETNELMLIKETTRVRKGRFAHVSLLPLSMDVTGITLTGFQYPLNDATLTIGQSLGISNVLIGEEGTIELKSGMLLVIRSRD
ncbi:MAG: thiamine diphosphokinase [Clostridia bacterium]